MEDGFGSADAAPLAQAMTRAFHSFGGVPMGFMALLYVPAGLAFALTRWCWELLPVAIIVHLWLRGRYRRDENWLANYLDALRQPQDLEP